MSTYLVSIGIHGSIGRFRPVDPTIFQRHAQVVCRTNRGLEVGTVLAKTTDPERHGANGDRTATVVDGDLLRKVTPDDDMILRRIEKFRERAFQACEKLIREREIAAVLVDVEHLFDGQNLFFYFLGEPSAALDELTVELAETYEAKVRFRKFTETLINGCGPDCGTGDGCTTGNCISCSVKSACGQRG